MTMKHCRDLIYGILCVLVFSVLLLFLTACTTTSTRSPCDRIAEPQERAV